MAKLTQEMIDAYEEAVTTERGLIAVLGLVEQQISERTERHEHGGNMNVTVAAEKTILPIHDPIERRAIALKLAIEAKSFRMAALDANPQEHVDIVLAAAQAFEAYVSGEAGPHEWQEYNEYHNTCHYPGCTAEESAHPTREG